MLRNLKFYKANTVLHALKGLSDSVIKTAVFFWLHNVY